MSRSCGVGAVDARPPPAQLARMSIAEIKATISKMNVRQRRELRRYLNDLETEPKPGTMAWKREMARRINEMQAGNFYTLDEARAMLTRKRS